MTKKLKIWCNNLYIPLLGHEEEWLRNSLREFDFHLFQPLEKGVGGESAKVLRDADIAFGSPDPDALLKCDNLAWIHINTAGYTAYDRQDFQHEMKRRNVIITNSSSVYDEPCAEHLLAMMLSLSRKLPESLDEQRGARSWKDDDFRPKMTLLKGQVALVFGFGSIAKKLVEYLSP